MSRSFLTPEQNSGKGESNKVTNHVYANISINNVPKPGVPKEPALAEYLVEQNQPILSHQEDFQLRVVRFKIPMSETPLFIYEPDTFYLALAIVEEDDAFPLNDPRRVIHTSILAPREILHEQQIAVYNEAKDNIRGYKNGVYHVNDFLRQVNVQLRFLWDQALGLPQYTDIITGTGGTFVNEYPRLNWSPSQNRFYFELPLRRDAGEIYTSMFYPGRYDNGAVPPPGQRQSIRIMMSSELYTLFNGFPAFDFGPKGVRSGTTNLFIPELTHGLSLEHNRGTTCRQDNVLYGWQNPAGLPPGTSPEISNAGVPTDNLLPYPYQCIYQEQTSIFAWQRSSRILLASSMGFVKETAVFNDSDGRPKTFEVLTDFAIQQDSSASPREYIYYNDQGANRYIDTKSTGVLSRIDIKIFIEYDNGFRIPLFISPRQEVNIKLAFDRKDHNTLKQISNAEHHTFEN